MENILNDTQSHIKVKTATLVQVSPRVTSNLAVKLLKAFLTYEVVLVSVSVLFSTHHFTDKWISLHLIFHHYLIIFYSSKP